MTKICVLQSYACLTKLFKKKKETISCVHCMSVYIVWLPNHFIVMFTYYNVCIFGLLIEFCEIWRTLTNQFRQKMHVHVSSQECDTCNFFSHTVWFRFFSGFIGMIVSFFFSTFEFGIYVIYFLYTTSYSLYHNIDHVFYILKLNA